MEHLQSFMRSVSAAPEYRFYVIDEDGLLKYWTNDKLRASFVLDELSKNNEEEVAIFDTKTVKFVEIL